MKFFSSLTFDFIDMLDFEERPFRSKFIPAKVWDDLDTYMNDSEGLRNYFKKWKTSVKFQDPYPKKEGKYIPVGGWYLPDTNRCVIDIYTTNYDKFQFTDKSWKRLKYKIIQVIMHEFVHCRQYMNKGEDYCASVVKFHKTGISKIDDNRHYHSGRDEIDAYAHCIYLEYKVFKPSLSIIELIRRARSKKDSVTFNGIIRVFGNDPRNNFALPLLARKILKWERRYIRYGIT